jgi:CRP/FNR family transcriptional regulator
MHQIPHFEELCSISKEVEVPKGVRIQDLDTQNTKDVFALAEGVCALSKMTLDGEERIFRYFTPNWLLRIVPVSLADYWDKDFLTNIHTRTPCRVYQLEGLAFMDFIRKRPDLAESVIKILAHNMMMIQSVLFDFHDLPAGLRLCKVILDLDNGEGIPSFFTHEELGGFIGTHKVTVARIISALKKQNLIDHQSRKIIITHRKQLIDMVQNRRVFSY